MDKDLELFILEALKEKKESAISGIKEATEERRKTMSLRNMPYQESEIYKVINKLLKDDKIEV
jgi:hypothetical protein